MSDDKQLHEVNKDDTPPSNRSSEPMQQSQKSKVSAQVDADLRAQLRPELRKLYDLYYKDGK